MAEQHEQVEAVASAEATAETGGRSFLGVVAELIGAVVSGAIMAVEAVWNAATDDGVLAAAARQGVDEIGMALKAFPDAIQAHEVGTLFEPTQGEIAAARSDDNSGGLFRTYYSYQSFSHSAGPREDWPSEIVSNSPPYDPGLDHGHDHGDGHSM